MNNIKSKTLALLLTLSVFASYGALSACAYNTQVTYDTTAQGQSLDINGDGTTDMNLTDTVTYGVQVPASLTVNGASDKAYVAGYTDIPIAITAPSSVPLTDVKGHTLNANIIMGTENKLSFNIALTKICRASTDVSSKWDNNNIPLIGSWTGTVTYTVKSEIDEISKYFDISSDGNISINLQYGINTNTGVFGNKHNLLPNNIDIPTTINGITIKSISAYGFACSEKLTSVTLPDTLTKISAGAFYMCTSLSSITIPNSVTAIEDGAFYMCTSLSNIALPSSITAIKTATFAGCAMTNITIPKSVTTIGQSAFGHCKNLTTINFTGTKADWNNINIDSTWKNESDNLKTVVCTDGTINL